MFDSFEAVAALIRDRTIAMVDLKFCDLWGRWHHVTVPGGRVTPRLLDDGVGFDGSSLGLRPVNAGDLVLVPDLATGFVDPFAEVPTLVFLCSAREADTRAVVAEDPRTIAQRAEALLRQSGIADRSLWGPEFEFYVFDRVSIHNTTNVASYRVDSAEGAWNRQEPGSGYTIPAHGGYHAGPPQDQLSGLRTRISRHLESIGIPVKYHHHEVGGAGQCEIETPLLGLLQACDATLIVKYIVRMTARAAGLTATFMPKPLFAEAGSGLHCHQQLWQGDQNLFHDADGYGHVSALGLSCIAGLLGHGPAVMAFTNPSTNSYRRLVPGYEAPVSAIFSVANRSAAIRIPKYATQPSEARFEFRPPDATCNPYLALAAQLLASLDGARRGLDPIRLGFGPVDEDVATLGPERQAAIKALPSSLGEAMTALERDHEFLTGAGVFPESLIQRWIASHRSQERDVFSRPHPYELELYYDL